MNLKLLDNRQKDAQLWEDRDIKFDVSSKELQFKDSEKKIRSFKHIEDTKGNTGDYGKIILSNLRLIWQSRSKSRINLTIGYNTIHSISKKSFHSELRGNFNSLHLLCKINGTRYEFIFTQFNSTLNEPISLTGEKNDLIYWLTHICKAYVESKLFRDLKLRSVLFTPNKQLKILPGEFIYDKIQGVWNLSSDQGNLGTMHLTDKRIVWVANLNELFNLSLPYIQINSIKIRESKFGLALVLETVSNETNSNYVLGFRIDPSDRLQKVYNTLTNLFNVHKNKPDYGVEKLLQKEQLEILDKLSRDESIDDGDKNANTEIEFVEEVQNVNPDVIASYLTDDELKKSKEKEKLVYASEIGLMIEAIKDGFTLDELFNIVNN